jgi:elongation factor P
MNIETYEEVIISGGLVHEIAPFLTPNLRVEIEYHEQTPLSVKLPKTVDLKVARADSGMRAAAVTNTLKSATLETRLVIEVPHFVAEGDTVTVNTESREYVSRKQAAGRNTDATRLGY